MTVIKALTVSCFILLAVASDIKARKIKNSVNACFLLSGLVLNAAMYGWPGLARSFLGMIAPVAVLIPLYALGMMGAGDVKMFAAVGAIMGFDFVLATMILSFLAGGAICLLLFVLKGYGKYRFKVLTTYLRTSLLTRRLPDYREFGAQENPGWFRFSLAVAPAVAAQLLFKLDFSTFRFAEIFALY